MSTLRNCPRCDERTFETLATHSHCLCCNYNPDLLNYKKSSSYDPPIPQWAEEALSKIQTKDQSSIFSVMAKKKGSAA